MSVHAAEQLPTAVNREQTIDYEHRSRTDTATWLAEVLYGSMSSIFYFDNDPVNGMVCEDGGKLETIFDDAITEARLITQENPAVFFELRRRLIERSELDDFQAMSLGELFTEDGEQANTIAVVSDYPPELMDVNEDVGGYNGARKQTMLRLITTEPDGRIRKIMWGFLE